MKNKRITLILIILLIIGSGVTYYIYNREDSVTTLNLLEKQWIEKNKNTVVDMGVVSNLPMFTASGSGIYFDFLTSLEEETGLKFNYLPFNNGKEIENKYKFEVKETKEKNDILIYTDNYVLLSRENKNVSLNELEGLTIGVVNDDIEDVNYYINNNDVVFKTFDNFEQLFESMEVVIEETEEVDEDEEKEVAVDLIAVPKTLYLKEILESELFITYQIDEMTLDFVVSLGSEKRLNDILTKYYKKWASDNYDTKYDEFFNQSYITYSEINEKEISDFRSKIYTYGYVDNAPYDYTLANSEGFLSNLLVDFKNKSEIDLKIKKYKTFDSLKEDFKDNKVDIMLNFGEEETSNEIIPRKFVVLLKNTETNLINSVASLNMKNVLIIKDSYVGSILEEKNIKFKEFDTIYDLAKHANDKDYLVVDYNKYNFYKDKLLDEYKTVEIIDGGSHSFLIDTNEEILNEYLGFYVSYNQNENIFNESFNEMLNEYENVNIRSIAYIALSAIGTVVVLLFIFIKISNRNNKKMKTVTKEDKLKYIDMLTSLKNRNYLNDNLEEWDSSEIYPQAILVLDLNNVAYINDNFGHAEGDKLIREAANILITTQETGSDIIRTSGNEFLIYLVGHEEKSVVSYKRKLAKEFKGISHGFGAAIGYSMILDGIKTIDDAINEATLDMRNNKEEE